MPTTLLGSTSQPVSSRVSRTAASISVSSGSRCPAGWLSTARPPLDSSTIRKRPLSSTMVATVMWGFQSIALPLYNCLNADPVGAGLLAKAVCQSMQMLNDKLPSRASTLPQRECVVSGNTNPGTRPGFVFMPTTLHQRSNRRVAGVDRAHGLAGQLRVGEVVTADVQWLALDGIEFGNDFFFVVGHCLGDRMRKR